MRNPWLYIVAPLLGAVVIGGALSSGATLQVVTLENLALFAAAAAAALFAGSSFDRGDYLRGVWVLLAMCPALLFADALLFGAVVESLPRDNTGTQSILSGALTLGANLSNAVALVLVARAWSVAGLDLQVSRALRWGSMALVGGTAMVLLAPSTAGFLDALALDEFEALPSLASAAGDVAAAALLVPLLLTARSLRGGALAWPWGLLAVATAMWLLFDGSEIAGQMLGLSGGAGLGFSEFFRAAACLFLVSASLAQRQAAKA